MAAHNDEHRVYLLRHGQTEWSSTGRHTSRTDVPLTPEGEQLAARAGATLTALRSNRVPAVVLSSPRKRAQRTAELAGLHDFTIEPLLAEWDYGEYEGLTTPEIREQVPKWTVWTHPCPGGESTKDITKRADKMMARVQAELLHGDVVLVGHGHFSRSFIARWIGLAVTAGVRFALEPAAITVLGYERGVAQMEKSNLPPWQDQQES